MDQTVTVFIGSGEASKLERKVLIHSLQRNSKRPLDIRVFNGTHNAVERAGHAPVLAPMSLEIKYRNITEFSLYRYLIPELMAYQGRAIYLDSDMISLGEIGELSDADMAGRDFLAKPEYGADSWTTSVMLIDCATTRFDLQQIYAEIDEGLYDYADFSRMTPAFLAQHPYRVGQIDPRWNEFDRWDGETRLIHYTDLLTQPWKHVGHPYGELWFQYFDEARAAGLIRDDDINEAKVRSYVRQDLLLGNAGALSRGQRYARQVRRLLGMTRHQGGI